MLYFAAANLLFVFVVAAIIIWRGTSIRRLVDVEPAWTGEWPAVSIVAPARNEALHIEEAVRSLVRLNYHPLQITLINDRSTDGTGDILNRLAAEFPQLNVVHLDSLPPGWLGKNHALQLGADRSQGEWLLFTDADILFDPDCLRRAMSHALSEQLDMLVAFPETRMPSWILKSFVATFSVMFMVFTRPWSVRNPRSGAHCGVGAFNLVQASAYHRADGHRRLAMRPDDDLKLGKNMKLSGARCDVIDGNGMLAVNWYGSLRELIVGLEKNSFAVVEYSSVAVLATSLSLLAVNFFPFIGPLFVEGPARWLLAASAALQIVLSLGASIQLGYPWHVVLGYPLTVLLFVYIQWRSMILALVRGGIQWRDTLYSLKELRENRV